MVHVIEALTPPEGNFASPSAIVVNGLPIQNVYYKGTLVRGSTGTAWPDKVVTKEDTWSVTSVNSGVLRYEQVYSPSGSGSSSGYRVTGTAIGVKVTKTKNELGLSGTVSCNTDGYSGYSYAMKNGSTNKTLGKDGPLSQSSSVTNPSFAINAIKSGTTLPDYNGADKISSEIVVSGSVRLAYTGTMSSGSRKDVTPTYTASWTRRVKMSIPQANPYIQVTAQEVSWKRDDRNIMNNSTMRAQWSVKIKWTSNDFCDLTGTTLKFAINGRVVAYKKGTSTIDKTVSRGTTTSTYTLAAGTGEETLTLSCSWSDNSGGYISSNNHIPYAVKSNITATVSDIPANATSSGSLAIAEKSSSIHSLIHTPGAGSASYWPSGWFDTTSLSDVSMIQFLQKAGTADNVLIRVPKTITVDSKIVIEGAALRRAESAGGTDLIVFSYTSIKLASVTWGVASNLSFGSDLRLCFKLSISNKTEGSTYITFTIPTTGTTSGTATDIVCDRPYNVSCEEYADLEGTDQDCYTDIRIEPAPTHEYTIYPSLSYTERKNAYNPIYNDALPYASCHVQTASMVVDYGYKRKDPLPDISRMPGTGFGGFGGLGPTSLWAGPLVETSPANIYSDIVYDKPAPPPYITITGCILPALPAEVPDSDWVYYWYEDEGIYTEETGYAHFLVLRVDELYSYVNSIVARRTDASALSRIYGDIALPTITLRLTPSWDSSLAISITDPGNMARVNHDDIGDTVYDSNYVTYGLADRETYMQVTGIENIPAANRKVSVDFIYGTNWEIPTTRYASDTRTMQGIAMAPSSTTIHVGELDLADGTSTDLDQAFLDLFTAYNAQYTTAASREPYTYEITYRSN